MPDWHSSMLISLLVLAMHVICMQTLDAGAVEWLQLPMVCVPVREFTDGGFGFLTADTAAAAAAKDAGAGAVTGAAPRPAIVGFADRGDAQQVQWLWDSWPQTEVGSNRCARGPLWFLAKLSYSLHFSCNRKLPMYIHDSGRHGHVDQQQSHWDRAPGCACCQVPSEDRYLVAWGCCWSMCSRITCQTTLPLSVLPPACIKIKELSDELGQSLSSFCGLKDKLTKILIATCILIMSARLSSRLVILPTAASSCLDSCPDEPSFQCANCVALKCHRVMPLPPAKLQSVAQEQGFSVVVFPKGQLPLRPGMSEEELGALFSAYAVH